MNLFSASSAPFIIYFLTSITAAIRHQEYLAGDVSINCGSTEDFAAVDDREWIGERHNKFSSFVRIKGSSASSNIVGSIVSADQAQYKTARISRSQFSYAFHLHPGPKFIRLHFNPVSYRGFRGSDDLFTVEAGPFILLGNFSASLTADALGGYGKSFAKEFLLSQIGRHRQLPWILYFKIIIGIARGVSCLHQSPDLRTIFSNMHPQCADLTPGQIFQIWKLWNRGRALDQLRASMGSEFSSEEATRCIKIGLLCTQFLPQHRPDISVVLGALQGDQDLKMELREARVRRKVS